MGQLFATEKRPITEVDRIRLGGELADASRQLAAEKVEKSAVAKVYAGRIGKLESRISSISRQLHEGELEVQFEVEEVPDDSRQIIAIIRIATGEIHDTRPMNEAEKAASLKRRQTGLFDDGDARDTDRAPAPRKSGLAPKAGKPKAAKKGAKRA